MTHKKVYYPCCKVCGERFKTTRIDAEKCSGKCRMRWIREINDKPEQSINTKTLQRMSKSMKVDCVTCSWCDRYFSVNGNNRNRRYCSDACQQAAYRFRKSLIDEWLNGQPS